MKTKIAQYVVGAALVMCILLGSNALGVIRGD
jgi:hypothetical protein